MWGHEYSLLDFPDVNSIVRVIRRDRPDKEVEAIRDKIKPFLKNWYKRFGDRFQYIGDPRGQVEEEPQPEVHQVQRRRRPRS